MPPKRQRFRQSSVPVILSLGLCRRCGGLTRYVDEDRRDQEQIEYLNAAGWVDVGRDSPLVSHRLGVAHTRFASVGRADDERPEGCLSQELPEVLECRRNGCGMITLLVEPGRNPRSTTMRMRMLSIPLTCCSLAILVVPARAGVEITATRSLTIRPDGPRTGDAGSKYLNVEGKDNEKYASYGVLVFDLPKEVKGSEVKAMSLTLTQSIPQFAKDGAIKFLLALDVDAAEDLKFDASTPDGVGSRIKPLHALGSGTFKKVETGKTESFSLSVDDSVRERIVKGGKLFVVIVPADATVAATYFGERKCQGQESQAHVGYAVESRTGGATPEFHSTWRD